MDLLAVSPAGPFPDEAELIRRLLDAGLDRYHLRKPDWTRENCRSFLRQLPAADRGAIQLHQHHDLVEDLGLGGRHWKDNGVPMADVPPAFPSEDTGGVATKEWTSRSVHTLEELVRFLPFHDYLLLCPVFSSISKPGHNPPWTEKELAEALENARLPEHGRIYALGGIGAANAPRCADLGFDGIVLHGALWKAADPLNAFHEIRRIVR